MILKKIYVLIFFNIFIFVIAQDKSFRPTYVFKGNLKNQSKEYSIKMNFLVLLDSSIVGSYYYKAQNGSLNLAGKLNSDNSFILSEWFENKNTGTFKGNFSKNKMKIYGVWKSEKGESYTFKLNQIKDESYWNIIKKNRSLFEYTDLASIETINKKKVLSVDLANQKLTKLPNYFNYLSKIESINLLGNKFEKFPIILTELNTLDEISLSTNQLKEIPSNIKNLKNLKILILNNNRLTKLPKEIGQLRELKYLELGNNYLTELPIEIKSLTRLEEIHLEKNDFSEIEKKKIKNLLPNCVIHF